MLPTRSSCVRSWPATVVSQCQRSSLHSTYIENLPLLDSRILESNVNVPAALVVENVRSNLANLLGGTVAVEVVVLYLEVLAEGEEDVEGEVVRGLVRHACHSHREGDGEVERVERSLVHDDEVVPDEL